MKLGIRNHLLLHSRLLDQLKETFGKPGSATTMMTKLLLVLLGLSVAVLAQDDRDFLVLDDEPPSDELDVADLTSLASKAGSLLSGLGRAVNTSGLDCFEDRPSPYDDLAKSSSSDAFSVSGSTDVEAVEAQSLSRGRRQVSRGCANLPLYHCPHTTRILYWFPIRWGSYIHAYCYIPWASRQRVTYAACDCRGCNLYGGRTGRCRPSCYQRRRMLVWCYYPRLGFWRWHWHTRSLPQACSCSAC